MRKQIYGKQLSRDTNERKSLFRSLMSELVMHERIETTEQKAKSIKGHVEKLVTKVKNKGVSARVLISPYLTNHATDKMIDDIAPRFITRPGGYTRIIKLNKRLSDNASMVLIEWVEKGSKMRAESGELRNRMNKKTNIDEAMADVVYGQEKGKNDKTKK